MDSIGRNVKTARIEAGLTQARLADKAEISRSYLAGVEQERYNPSVKTLIAIAKATCTDLNFLAGMTEKQVRKGGKTSKVRTGRI